MKFIFASTHQFKFFKVIVAIFALCYLVTPALVALEEFIVSGIRVDGLQRVSKQAVLQEANISIGQKINLKKSHEIISSLYKTNFFSDIRLEKDRQVLVIKLTERPIISKLTLTGVKHKETINKILREAKIIEGLVYNSNVMRTAEIALEQYYYSQRKYGVRVTSSIKKLTRNRVELYIDVQEGCEATIKEIKINGNVKFQESELLRQLVLGKRNLFSWYTKNNHYLKEQLDADLEVLKSYYMDRGYINIQIDSTNVSLTADQKKVYITINLTEGEQYKFGKINVSGALNILNQNQLDAIIKPLKSGAVFSRQLLLQVKKQFELELANLGYIKAEVNLHFDEEPAHKTMNIDISIKPNQKMIVRKIVINGNYVTEDEVIRRMLPQLEGTWFAQQNVDEGKAQILRYGYASNVEVMTREVPKVPNQVDIEYKIEQQRNMQLQANLMYLSGEGFGFGANANVKNFFGTGRDIELVFQNTEVNTSYKFSYYNPYFNLERVGLGFDAYLNRRNLSKNSGVSEYSTDNLGCNVTWSVPISQHSAIFYSLGYNETTLDLPSNVPQEIKLFTDLNGLRYKEYILNLCWKTNSLDRYILPTSGFSQKINFKYNLPMSKLNYYIISYDCNWYKPLDEDKKYIFNVATDLGYGGKYTKNTYPFFQNFFIGGADSVRGFEERSLGPKDSLGNSKGGNLLINLKTAIIFPVPFKQDLENIRPSVFMDIGQVYDTFNRGSLNNKDAKLRYSVGVSCAIHTPLGPPIVLSLGYPLNRRPMDNRQIFSLTFDMGTN